MSDEDLKARAALALELADAARPNTLKHFRNRTATDNKDAGGFDPVTEGDRAAEAAIRAARAATSRARRHGGP